MLDNEKVRRNDADKKIVKLKEEIKKQGMHIRKVEDENEKLKIEVIKSSDKFENMKNKSGK